MSYLNNNNMVEEDLIIGSEEVEEEALVEAIDAEIYIPTDSELVAAACEAINTIESIDPLTERGRKRKKRIIRKAMEILDFAVDNLHALCFDKEETDEDSQES